MDNNVIKTDTTIIFDNVVKSRQCEEVGISFDGETKIDDQTSVITNKDVKADNPEEAKETYLKVLEMRELTEAEMENVSSAKKILNAAFSVLCHKSKLCVSWAIFMVTALGLNIYEGDFLQILVKVACLILVLSPVKFAKEVHKILSTPNRLEELREYLQDKGVLGYAYVLDRSEDIKLYAKIRTNKHEQA